MKNHLLILVLFYSLSSYSQLAGKVVWLTEGMRQCGTFLKFPNDTLAFRFQGCESTQYLTAYRSELKPNGLIELNEYKTFSPFGKLYRNVVNSENSYDPKSIVVISNESKSGISFMSEVKWKLYGKDSLYATGSDLQNLDEKLFKNPEFSLSIDFLNVIAGKDVRFHYSDFPEGEGRCVISSYFNYVETFCIKGYETGGQSGKKSGEQLVYWKDRFTLLKNGKKVRDLD